MRGFRSAYTAAIAAIEEVLAAGASSSRRTSVSPQLVKAACESTNSLLGESGCRTHVAGCMCISAVPGSCAGRGA